MPAAVSLFSGCGGGALALRDAGYTVVACIDNDKDSCATLRANGFATLECDIRTFDWSLFTDIDIVVGGPPCQPFSAAGKGHGFEDPRDCIPDFCRAIEIIRPRVFVMENVRGLTFKKHAEYLQLVLESFPSDYEVDHRILNAADFGVPQTRQRVFVVGRLDSRPTWPVPTHAKADETLRPWVSMASALGWGMTERPSYTATGGGTTTGGAEPFGSGARSLMERERERSLVVTRGNRKTPGGNAFPTDQPSWALTEKARSWTLHTNRDQRPDGSRQTRPVSEPAPTFTDKAGGQWQVERPEGKIYLTPTEAATLQAFPDDWTFVGTRSSQFRQIGNACPPQFIGAVITAQTDFRRSDGFTFYDAVDSAWDTAKADVTVGDMLTKLSPSDYDERACYLTDDRRTGYCITSGDLGALFNVGPSGRGAAAVASAVDNGACTLDCLGPWLPDWYLRQGWTVDHWEPNWTPGGPAVAYMKWEN